MRVYAMLKTVQEEKEEEEGASRESVEGCGEGTAVL
jgi:hypothetical protein